MFRATLALSVVSVHGEDFPTAYIGLPDGERIVVNASRSLLSKRTGAGTSTSSTVSMESCFRKFCSSDFALNEIREAAKKSGYTSWDQITYHNTYFNEGETYAYRWGSGKVVYDTLHRKDSDQRNVVVYTATQNNPTNSEGTMRFIQDVGEQVSMSWSSSQSYAFTDGVSTSVKVGFPEIAEVSTSISWSETWSLTEGTTKTASTSQSSSIQNDLPVDPHTCARGCAVGSSTKVEVPYTLSGRFSPSGSAYYGNTQLTNCGAVCCYLRPGGSSECPTMGHNKGGTGGWYIAPSPGYAAYQGACPNLGYSGNDAVFSQGGLWSAGMDLSVDVNEVVGPEGQCPEEGECIASVSFV